MRAQARLDSEQFAEQSRGPHVNVLLGMKCVKIRSMRWDDLLRSKSPHRKEVRGAICRTDWHTGTAGSCPTVLRRAARWAAQGAHIVQKERKQWRIGISMWLKQTSPQKQPWRFIRSFEKNFLLAQMTGVVVEAPELTD